MQWANRRLRWTRFRYLVRVTFDLARALLNLFREAPHRRAPTRLAPSILRLWNRVTAPKVPEWETFCAQSRLKNASIPGVTHSGLRRAGPAECGHTADWILEANRQ
jgi:hypothetical protein